MQNLKVIFLDWNGTICKNVFWEQLNNITTRDIFNKITSSLFTNNSNLINIWMKNRISANDIVNVICNETGIDKYFLKEQLILSSLRMNFFSLEIKSVIKEIQDNYVKVVLASDNMDVFRYTITNLKLDLLFDDMILSNEVGFLKNEMKDNKSLFFDNYINKHNLKYSDCVLVDDSKELQSMCKNVGMNNIKIEDCKDTIHELKKLLNNLKCIG